MKTVTTGPYHTRDDNGNEVVRTIDTWDWYRMIVAQAVRVFGEDIRPLFDRYVNRCDTFESGRNRGVFLFNTYVVKLPITEFGVADNDWEGSISDGPDPYVHHARTRMAYHNGIPILFMERVQYATIAKMVKLYGTEPDWVSSVDCGQVGWNGRGKLVAFDYGRY